MVCSFTLASPKGWFITSKDWDPGGSPGYCDEIAWETDSRCYFRSSTYSRGVVEPLPKDPKSKER